MFLTMKELESLKAKNPNSKYSGYWKDLGSDGLTELDVDKLLSKIFEKYGQGIDEMFSIKSMIDARFKMTRRFFLILFNLYIFGFIIPFLW